MKIPRDEFDKLFEDEGTFIEEVAEEFAELLDDWHSVPEVWDHELDAEIHRWYSSPPKVRPKKPYFSPSAANADPRELYMKGIGEKKDVRRQQPHQKRWTQIGTAVGDMIQRDLLFAEKHGERLLGYAPRFRFERNADGLPMFEDFAKKNRKVEYKGVGFHLFGAPDGVMEYVADDGEIVRIGLEIKTKQTTPARTSLYSMKEPEEKHVKQTVAYALMYDLDYYLIVYVNTAHKGWEISAEDYHSTPDVRVFGVETNRAEKVELLERLAWIQTCINKREMPPMDIYKYTFNNFKTACALSLTEEELAEFEVEYKRVKATKAPAFIKNGVRDAIKDIRKIRKENLKK